MPALSDTSAVNVSVPVRVPTSTALKLMLNSPPLARPANVFPFTPNVTVWPSSAVVVPLTTIGPAASLAFSVPSPAIVSIVTVGAVVSTVSVCVPAALTLPAASVAVTETEFVPFAFTASVPLAGVALPVSILHEPSVAVVV